MTCVCNSLLQLLAGHPASLFPMKQAQRSQTNLWVGLKPHHTLHTRTTRPQPLELHPVPTCCQVNRGQIHIKSVYVCGCDVRCGPATLGSSRLIALLTFSEGALVPIIFFASFFFYTKTTSILLNYTFLLPYMRLKL